MGFHEGASKSLVLRPQCMMRNKRASEGSKHDSGFCVQRAIHLAFSIAWCLVQLRCEDNKKKIRKPTGFLMIFSVTTVVTTIPSIFV